MILFDGFSEFSNPEVEILNKLSSVGNTKLYIRFDYAQEQIDLLISINVMTSYIRIYQN